MEVVTILTILTLLVGFYMAWNIGANDVSNAMGTSVGSGALTLRHAVIIAAILEFCGAFFVGGNVSKTMQSGLIDTTFFAGDPLILVLGFTAALLGTSVWLQAASYFGWPVSTTHAIVGAIVGFGAVVGGVDTVKWAEVGSIAASWVVTPLMSGIIAFFAFSFLQKRILFKLNPTEAAKKLLPPLVFIVIGTYVISLLFNGLKNLEIQLTFWHAAGIAIVIALIAAMIAFTLVRRLKPPKAVEPQGGQWATPQVAVSLNKAVKHLQRVKINTQDEMYEKVSRLLSEVKGISRSASQNAHILEHRSEYRLVEKLFRYLQIISASFIAFAHGANDVANAIGPVAAVLDILKNGAISASPLIPSWLLAMGGVGIVIGLATWGWRVIETIGKKITELTPTRGFCAEFGAATTILLASKFGLPISTTHCLVGAVLGVGLAGGLKALNLSTLREIVLSWIVTLPASAITSICFFYLLRAIFI